MEASFMKAEERERLIREKGREEGREEGRRQVELIKLLLEKKQYDDAKRVTEDEEYCEQLCEEYNIQIMPIIKKINQTVRKMFSIINKIQKMEVLCLK